MAPRPDPADGRAKLVVATEAGLEVIGVVHAVSAGIERRLRRALGAGATTRSGRRRP